MCELRGGRPGEWFRLYAGQVAVQPFWCLVTAGEWARRIIDRITRWSEHAGPVKRPRCYSTSQPRQQGANR